MEELQNLIKAYLEKVAIVQKLFLENLATDNPLKAWAQQEIPKEGFLDKEKNIHYSFHGVGCRVIFPDNQIVDFDYGPGYRYDGFDPGRIYMFLKNRLQTYPNLNTIEKVEGHFVKLIDNGVIQHPPFKQLSRQYYFTEKK